MSRNNIAAATLPKKQKFSVIIPAAGEGSRMKSYGPKSLLKLSENVSVVQHQLYNIHSSFKQCEIILVTGFQAKRVIDNTPNNIIKVVNQTYNKNNVAKSISLGLKRASTKHVVIVYGDLVFNEYALRVPFGIDSALVIDKSNLMGKDEVGCVINNHSVEQLMYGLPKKWAQIAYFTGKELQMLKTYVNNPKMDVCFGFEIINKIISAGGNFIAYEPKHIQVTDIDSSKDIQKARDIYENSSHPHK